MLLTSLIVLNTLLLVVMTIVVLKFKRDIPDIEQVLVDVGGSISEKLQEIFSDAPVKKAMGILGKHSGEARADAALQKKAASAIMDQFPGLNMVLDQFGMTPLEGVKLLRDPLIGPFIQNAIGGFMKGAKGFSFGGGGSSYQSGGSNSGISKVE